MEEKCNLLFSFQDPVAYYVGITRRVAVVAMCRKNKKNGSAKEKNQMCCKMHFVFYNSGSGTIGKSVRNFKMKK